MAQSKKSKKKTNVKPTKKAAVKKPAVKKTVKAKAKPAKAKAVKKTVVAKKTTKAKVVKAKPAKANITAKKTKPAKGTGSKKTTTITKPVVAKAQGPKGRAWLHPLDDRILVEVAEKEPTTPSGLILIDTTNQPDNLQGFVIAVGRGHQNKKGRIRPVEVKAGDKVIFSKYAGDKVSQDGVNFVIIRESEVLGFASN